MGNPSPSSPEALGRMRGQRRRDTEPEIRLRRELHRLGLRFRVDQRVLPSERRRPDIVFGPAKVAVFVDGCFWHVCPRHGTSPRANAAWWEEKLAGNVARDRETDRLMEQAGWLSIRVWEHEDACAAAYDVVQVVRERRRLAKPLLAR